MVVRRMKEKCKDAARTRREKERAEFAELSKLLPLPTSTTSQLDKASIIRLTSSYLRMRSAFPEGLGENWGNDSKTLLSYSRFGSSHQEGLFYRKQSGSAGSQAPHQQAGAIKELGSLILQTLDGFVFALHRDGKIMYVSETASVHLGLPQIDLTGSSVFDYVHQSDHNELCDMLALTERDRADIARRQAHGANQLEVGRSFCIRMKCILPKRNAGLTNSGYKAIHCNGYLKLRRRSIGGQGDLGASSPGSVWESYALVAVGHSLLPTASTEIKLNSHSFMFRANLDLRLYYIEAIASKLLGFQQVDMVGRSLYQFVHANDIVVLEKSHRSLLDKGQVVSKYYRLMKRDGGSVWIQSYETLVNNPRNMPKPQHIVGICMVLGYDPLDQSCMLNQMDTICSQARVAATKGAAKLTSDRSNDLKSLQSSTNSQLPSQPGASKSDRSIRRINPRHTAIRKLSQRTQSHLKSSASPASTIRFINDDRLTYKQSIAYHKPAESAAEPERLYCTNSCACQLDYDPGCYLSTPYADTLSVSIGPTRRSSDDTCSLISSAASTSLSSSSLSSQVHSSSSPIFTSNSNDAQNLTYTIPHLSSSYPLQILTSSSLSSSSSSSSTAVSSVSSYQNIHTEFRIQHDLEAGVHPGAVISADVGQDEPQHYQDYHPQNAIQQMHESSWVADAMSSKSIEDEQPMAIPISIVNEASCGQLPDYSQPSFSHGLTVNTDTQQHCYPARNDWLQTNLTENQTGTQFYHSPPEAHLYASPIDESLVSIGNLPTETHDQVEFTQYLSQNHNLNHYQQFNDVYSVTSV